MCQSHEIRVNAVEELLGAIGGEGKEAELLQRLQSSGLVRAGGKRNKDKEVLSVPLAQVKKDRVSRKVAYKKTSRDVGKWQDVVMLNSRAHHVKFPLNAPTSKETASSTVSLSSKFEPTTDLEKQIESIMKESGVSNEKDIETFELEKMEGMSREEIEERQQQLSNMRNLLFYHELKMKRWKKIKSKQFRKVRKRAEEREKSAALDAMGLDPEYVQQEQIKAEEQRALERMTLKHKNTGKWAKRVLKRGIQSADKGTRAAMEEQARIQRDLLRKQTGESSSSEEDEEEDDSEADAEFEAEMKAQKGIMGMRFMQRAMEKKKAEYEKVKEAEQTQGHDEEGEEGRKKVCAVK